jgi:ergothioneine biosynthesis protein EgtB
MLMDAKHVLSQHPGSPAYAPRPSARLRPSDAAAAAQVDAGVAEIGCEAGVAFCFDNELPRHGQYLERCELDATLVSAGEYLEFMDAGGYERPELWLSEGWSMACTNHWRAPLYWTARPDGWHRFTLFGDEPVAPDDPVSHMSYFEADAYARWRGARLPTEAEWEVAAAGQVADAPFALEPPPVTAGPGWYGSVWQWTQSAYSPYPGFKPAAGAVGEYNGKFMVNQQVLRGGASVTPQGHTRRTYRNFYAAACRWPFTGLRLARDG